MECLSPLNSPKQYRAKGAKRLSGRPAAMSSTSSFGSLENLVPIAKTVSQLSDSSDAQTRSPQTRKQSHRSRSSHIISQVRHWLNEEKARRAARQHKSREGASRLSSAAHATSALAHKVHEHGYMHRPGHRRRASSASSDSVQALEKLEQILAAGIDLQAETAKEDRAGSYFPRRASRLLRKQSVVASSDTECQDNELYVPSADVVLDHSKTMGYCGGGAASELNLPELSERVRKDKEGWLQFKYEIVRLSHTLKLPRWRRVPLEQSGDIVVERLSGALTNAVYVVSPPSDMPLSTQDPRNSTTSVASTVKRSPP